MTLILSPKSNLTCLVLCFEQLFKANLQIVDLQLCAVRLYMYINTISLGLAVFVQLKTKPKKLDIRLESMRLKLQTKS